VRGVANQLSIEVGANFQLENLICQKCAVRCRHENPPECRHAHIYLYAYIVLLKQFSPANARKLIKAFEVRAPLSRQHESV